MHSEIHAPQFNNVEWALQRFESAEREAWQRPDEVVAALHLRGGEVVADIGASTGFFSRRLARAVGPSGRVLARDCEAAVLKYLAERAGQEGLDNLETRVASADNPYLPAGGVDVILMVNTLHHVDDRAAYLIRLRHSLKPEGRLVVVDFLCKKTPVGPPVAYRISRRSMIDAVRRAGFDPIRQRHFLPYQYFLICGRG